MRSTLWPRRALATALAAAQRLRRQAAPLLCLPRGPWANGPWPRPSALPARRVQWTAPNGNNDSVCEVSLWRRPACGAGLVVAGGSLV